MKEKNLNTDAIFTEELGRVSFGLRAATLDAIRLRLALNASLWIPYARSRTSLRVKRLICPAEN
jgi:hypothetical protein